MRLRPSDSGPRLAVGVQGSGKSYGQGRDVVRCAETRPVLLLDATGEYDEYEPPENLRAFGARSVARAVKLVDEEKAQLVVVQPSGVDALTAADQMCEWALRDKRERVGVVFPEAHNIFPMGSKLPPHVRKCVTAARHWHVAFFADTQRLAELHPAITSAAAAAELRCYAFWADTDLKAVQNLGGREMREAVVRIYTEHFQRAVSCCFEGCAKCAKHRGWFVTAGPPPHVIERDDAR